MSCNYTGIEPIRLHIYYVRNCAKLSQNNWNVGIQSLYPCFVSNKSHMAIEILSASHACHVKNSTNIISYKLEISMSKNMCYRTSSEKMYTWNFSAMNTYVINENRRKIYTDIQFQSMLYKKVNRMSLM